MRTAILFLAAAISLHGAVSTLGWHDLGSGTILHNALGPGGVTVQDCTTGGPPPAYCTGYAQTNAFGYHSQDRYVVDDQSGATADTVHNCLYVIGGGHNDYVGNQVYASCAANNWTMVRLTDPSGPIAATGNVNPDGTMPSTHTGQGLVWMPNEGAVFVWGIGLGPAPSLQTTGWWFVPNSVTNPTSGTWVMKSALADPTNNTGQNCAMYITPAGVEQIYCTDYQIFRFYLYLPASDTWTQLTGTNGTEVVEEGSCAIYPQAAPGVVATAISSNGPYMICGGLSDGAGPATGVYAINLASGSSYASVNVTSLLTGCAALYSQRNPGLKWDSNLGTFVSFTGYGGVNNNVVTFFDPVTGLCKSRNFGGGPALNTHMAWGLYDRFSFFPSLNLYVALVSATTDMFTLTLDAAGLGGSFINSSGPCKDIDGDGYGVGAGCLGIDADDNDATVHTSAQVIAKYGSIQNFLLSIGYQNAASLSNVRCISPTGNDGTGVTSTNADTACATPYLTWAAAQSGLTNPQIQIFRAGTWTSNIGSNGGTSSIVSGTAGAQNIIMAYPGEQPIIDVSGGSGQAVFAQGVSYVTVDGFRLKANASGAAYAGGTQILYNSGSQTIAFIGNVLTRCEMSGGGDDSNVDADNVTDFRVEENVAHDPYPTGGQHNVYIGSNTVQSNRVSVSRNIAYNVDTGAYPNIQFNGRCNACYFEQNVIYNQDGQGLSLLQGVSNSFVRNNLVFNTGTAGHNQGYSFVLDNYDSSGTCQVNGSPSICSWDQTNNVIENNTFWAGTTGPYGGSVQTETVEIANTATNTPCGAGGSAPCGNLGGNFYRNNLIVGSGPVSHAANSGYSPVVYTTSTPNYLASDTWTNNIINSQDGSLYILGQGSGASYGFFPYNCASFATMALSSTGCSTANPLFVNAATSNYNSPQSFNFALQSGSPGLGAGTPVGAPALDLLGTPRSLSTPSLGALEQGVNVGSAAPQIVTGVVVTTGNVIKQ